MMEKKGQLAIFVIVAIVIAAVVMAIFIFPEVRQIVTPEVFTPVGLLRGCIEPELKKGIDILSERGGYFEPEGFVLYQGERVKYLCYTAENYKTCRVQQPLIRQQFEKELEKNLSAVIIACTNELKEEYEDRGFGTSLGKVGANISLTSGKINVRVNVPLTIRKEGTESFEGFDIVINSKMYELILTATSILEFESALGDAETTLYMRYYPDLTIRKVQLSEGTTVYTLSDIVTGEKFTFASRSVAWPAGYGLT